MLRQRVDSCSYDLDQVVVLRKGGGMLCCNTDSHVLALPTTGVSAVGLIGIICSHTLCFTGNVPVGVLAERAVINAFVHVPGTHWRMERVTCSEHHGCQCMQTAASLSACNMARHSLSY